MPVQNHEIADAFAQVAALLQIEGANVFRVRAYQNAALTLRDLPQSAADLVARGEDLSELPGIGRDLAGKITEMVTTGRLKALEEIKRRLPPGLLDMLKLPGLGPKRVQTLYAQLKLTSLDQLQKAAAVGRLRELPGFGAKLEAQVLKGIRDRAAAPERMLWAAAEPVVRSLVEKLKQVQGADRVVAAGSFRRCRETIGDLDILATGPSARLMQAFLKYEDAARVLARGATRSTVVFRTGLQVDLRVVPAASYGAALNYFTGSKEHNVALRQLAQKQGLKLNEYGAFRGAKRVAGRTEQEIYALLDLPYIEPELREMRGELDAARAGTLPGLVTLADLRGDLHAHTDQTDGNATLEEMAVAARARGYTYLAVTDHSQRVTMARGLDAKRLARQLDDVDALNARLKGITLLKGLEVDILEDGSLDLSPDLLDRLDLTVCSIHSKFNLSREKQTERILRAMDDRHFRILGHPTGRLINERPPYELDLERVIRGAAERRCFLELNAHPQRLDLTDVHCQLAKAAGVKVAVSTDAHSVLDLGNARFGINQARRGWLGPDDVLNTRPLKELMAWLKR
jgi:DNA polymerase (family X)